VLRLEFLKNLRILPTFDSILSPFPKVDCIAHVNCTVCLTMIFVDQKFQLFIRW